MYEVFEKTKFLSLIECNTSELLIKKNRPAFIGKKAFVILYNNIPKYNNIYRTRLEEYIIPFTLNNFPGSLKSTYNNNDKPAKLKLELNLTHSSSA